ncbi:MAG: urease accessory protein UreD, partial [Minwuia sp.]|nr:urease accessory protein UreD [Minwuia sp.]
ARVAFLGVGARTALADLHQQGCMKARLPNSYAGDPKTAVLINTAGGLTGGDNVSTEVAWHGTAVACVSTQAAERVYRSSGGDARVRNRLLVSKDARAEWLPQETILFDGGRMNRSTQVDLATGARFLAAETVILGRKAMGETVVEGALRDDWRVRRDGRLILHDAFALGAAIDTQRQRPALLDGAASWASLILQAPEVMTGKLLDLIREIGGPTAGATLRQGLVLGRILAADGDTMRGILARLLPTLRHAIMGHPERLPTVFRI